MPIYLFWGEDDFAMEKSIDKLKQKVLDPNWLQFNYQKLASDTNDKVMEALNQAMTPPFGMGGRFVWLADTDICQHCSETLLSELKRTLPVIRDTSHLLFSTGKKLDRRLKSTKLLQKYAQVKEFSLIPPWKTAEIVKKVRYFSQEIGVSLTNQATELLADAVGNDTRRLWSELEKLHLYAQSTNKPLDAQIISRLVVANTQNSLQLAAAIRQGKEALALRLVNDLINRNEPALKIVVTLIGQFRTWIHVKLMLENGERDEKVIANFAQVNNPKRIYFLRKEVKSLDLSQLLATLPILLELEVALKQGAQPLSTLQTQVVKLCQVCQRGEVRGGG